jgi:hypothetical protein
VARARVHSSGQSGCGCGGCLLAALVCHVFLDACFAAQDRAGSSDAAVMLEAEPPHSPVWQAVVSRTADVATAAVSAAAVRSLRQEPRRQAGSGDGAANGASHQGAVRDRPPDARHPVCPSVGVRLSEPHPARPPASRDVEGDVAELELGLRLHAQVWACSKPCCACCFVQSCDG